jgi:hypothetical protein
MNTTANRFAIAQKDLGDAQRYLMAWRSLAKIDGEEGKSTYGVHLEAIFMAAVVAYSRPFINSNSQGNAVRKINIEEHDIFNSEPELMCLHETIISRRHKAIAHTDWEYHSTQLEAVFSNGLTKRYSPRPNYMDGIDVKKFQELAEFICRRCMEKTYNLDIGSVQSEKS